MPEWADDVRQALSSLRLSPTRETEIVEELSQHMDDRWRELMAGGASAEEAARITRAEFKGGSMLAKDLAPLRQAQTNPPITPAAPTGRVLGDLLLDVRYASRMFRKQPAFTAVAVLTLALGIGANAAIFSVVYGVLLKPLPFHDPERLVGVYHQGYNQGPGDVLHLSRQQPGVPGLRRVGVQRSLDHRARRAGARRSVVRLGRDVTAARRTAGGRAVLYKRRGRTGTAPARGADARLLATTVWRRQRGRRDAARRRRARGGDRCPAGVVQVPAHEAGRAPADADRPRRHVVLRFPGRRSPQTWCHAGTGERRPRPDDPVCSPKRTETFRLQPDVRPLARDVVGTIGQVLWVLLAAVGLVLLIACANVANLFLVRAEGRQHELALRAALGASRGRIARGLLAESVLLGVAGGAVGLLLAKGGLGVLRRMAPVDLPRVDEIGIDGTVLLFTLAISLLSGILFGLVPIIRFGGPSVAALKQGGRSSSDAPGRQRTRNALVVSEVALAVVLLVVSGLMIRTFDEMRNVEPGFTDPEQIQTFRLSIPEELIADIPQVARTYEQIAERLAQVSGVTSVGLSSSITMDGEDNTNPLYVQGVHVADGDLPPMRRFKSLAPGYFETMGNQIVAGRGITWADIHQRRPVVVISENLAREFWQEPSKALGQRVRNRGDRPWHEIVGVVGNERDDGLNQPATAMVYWPLLHESYEERTVAFAVRSTRVGTPGFVGELQRAVWAVDSNLPLAAVQTVHDIRADSMAQTSFAMVMLAIAAGVALLLGVVGIYGVIGYVVSQRTREIGTRMALGAQPADVRRLFLRQGVVLTVTGIVLGVAASMVVTRGMSSLLFGVSAMDPVTYVVVAAALAGVALVATYLPARRASLIDPIVALRAGL